MLTPRHARNLGGQPSRGRWGVAGDQSGDCSEICPEKGAPGSDVDENCGASGADLRGKGDVEGPEPVHGAKLCPTPSPERPMRSEILHDLRSELWASAGRPPKSISYTTTLRNQPSKISRTILVLPPQATSDPNSADIEPKFAEFKPSWPEISSPGFGLAELEFGRESVQPGLLMQRSQIYRRIRLQLRLLPT